MKFAIFSFAFFVATAANAQSVANRVTGAVGAATSGVASTAGSAVGGSPDFSASNMTPGSAPVGGDWNGGASARIGGKDVTLRGAVASEGSSSAFKAGAGIGF